MQRESVFLNIVVKSFHKARRRPTPHAPRSPSFATHRGEAARACPPLPQPSGAWQHEDCANEPARFLFCHEDRAAWLLALKMLPILLLIIGTNSHAAVMEVGAIGITVSDLDKSVSFYTDVLHFQKIADWSAQSGAADQLLNLKGSRPRTARLMLGGEQIELTAHLAHKGRAIPADSHSYDHWFQHIAIVVRDMDAAYEQLRARKIRYVSTAPQTLPEWNRNAAGIKAFYFRDLDNHVLEIISFPPGKGDPKWQRRNGDLFMGIDHTAIVVSDTDKSLAFYRDLLGMRVAGESENYGVEQEHLNQVFGARLHITALRAAKGPGIEFLQYLTPAGGRPFPADSQASDLIFWKTPLNVDRLDSVAAITKWVSKRVVTPTEANRLSGRSVIIQDPDGHALQLIEGENALARN